MFTPDQIAANLDRAAYEASDDWHSAKQPVRFILPSDPYLEYEGHFIRSGTMDDVVAIKPSVRDSIADRLRSKGCHPEAIERIMAAPLRADGLVVFDPYMAILITSDPTNPARVSEARRKARAAQDKADRLARVAVQQMQTAAILAALPTEEVDRYIVEQMECPPERFAAFGKATRRDWRRRARQEMTAKRKLAN